MTGIAAGVVLEIILMFELGLPELARRRDFRHHLAGPQSRGFHIGDRIFGHRPFEGLGLVCSMASPEQILKSAGTELVRSLFVHIPADLLIPPLRTSAVAA